MTRARTKTAKATLDFFLGATRGATHWQRALRALTLFMVKGHAPHFFEQHELERVWVAALSRAREVPCVLPRGLSAIDAMSRLDAAWLSWATGGKPQLPDAAETREFIAGVKERDGLLWAWVMGELCAQMGLEASLGNLGERPLKASSAEEDLYWLTHQVLFATRYLSKPLPKGALAAERAELAQAVGPMKVVGEMDLLAEAAFCLQALGGDAEPAIAALEGFVGERGQVGKETGYLGAHAAAAALVALAGAVERAR